MLERQKMNPKQRAFLDELEEKMPQRGEGLHVDLMGRCNRGINAGFTADELYDILEPLRPWRPNELESTIQKAADEASEWQGESCSRGTTDIQKRTRKRKSLVATAGQILKENPERATKIREALIQSVGGEIDPFGTEVRTASNPKPDIIPPVELLAGSEFASGMLSFLRVAYRPDDLLYIGNKYESKEQQREHIKSVANWIDFFSDKLNTISHKPLPGTRMRLLMNLGYSHPLFCINPLIGEADENGSFRSSRCVKEFRYVLFEADNIPLEQQIPLIAALELPAVALTFSGSRSVHALTKVDLLPGVCQIGDLSEWKAKIPDIFIQLAPLGFDPATKDPVRPSRLPGIWRPDKKTFQQLLFLNPAGGFHV